MRRVFLGIAMLAALSSTSARLLAQSTIIQRVLAKVNGEVFTQKDLEDKQIEALQGAGKGDLQGDALAEAVSKMMPVLLVIFVDEILLLQSSMEDSVH